MSNTTDGPDTDSPVFVSDRRRRRWLAAAVGLIIVAAVVAVTSVVGAALVTKSPPRTPSISGAAAAASADATGPPFSVDPDFLRPSTPSGNEPCRTVEGTVFADLDGNGARMSSTEEGLPDVEVEVVDVDGNQRSDVTDENGRYRIEMDAASAVRVQFRGVSDQLMATPVGPDTHPWLTIVTGGPVCRVDSAGLYENWFAEKGIHGTPVREIGDRVWRDENGDGTQDPDEPGIAGVTLELTDSDGVTLATATTSPTGEYRFAGLSPASDYAIRVISSPSIATGPLGGLEPTESLRGSSTDGVAVAGASGWDSDLVSSNGAYFVLVPAAEKGASDHSIDLGFRPAS